MLTGVMLIKVCQKLYINVVCQKFRSVQTFLNSKNMSFMQRSNGSGPMANPCDTPLSMTVLEESFP